jgi:hypothetical protein
MVSIDWPLASHLPLATITQAKQKQFGGHILAISCTKNRGISVAREGRVRHWQREAVRRAMTMSRRSNDPPGAGDHGTADDHDSIIATTKIGVPSEINSSKFSTYSFILILLNLSAAAYLITQQSWHHSTVQLERELQLQMLQNELQSSESQINVLRYKMDALEHELMNMQVEERSKIISDGVESNVVVIDGQDEQEQYENLQLLEEEKQSAMDTFHNTALEFELDVDGYVDNSSKILE